MCLMPFTSALAELGLAVRQVRFNKEAAAMLQRRGTEIAQKLQDVVKATQGLPTGQVEAVARTVTAIGQALDEAAKFLQQFSEKGAFKKLCSGSLDARRFGLLDKRLCELSTELGSALDLQQLALQAQRFEKIEGLIQLLSQQTVDASNQAAARQAATMCGIEEGSAVEHEELSALGLKLDRIQGSVDELKGLVTAKNERLRGRALARQDKERALEPVWKSTSELGYLRNIAWTFVNIHAIEPTRSRQQRRVDGLKTPRPRADPAALRTSRRWRGAPEI
jgi:hypothetical protein